MQSYRAKRSRSSALPCPAVPGRWLLLGVLILLTYEVAATEGLFTGSEFLNAASVNFCQGQTGWLPSRQGCEQSWRITSSRGPSWLDSTWLLLEQLGRLRAGKWKLLGVALAVACLVVVLAVQSASLGSILIRGMHMLPYRRQLSTAAETSHADEEQLEDSTGLVRSESSGESILAGSQQDSLQQQQGSAKKANKAQRLRRRQREAAQVQVDSHSGRQETPSQAATNAPQKSIEPEQRAAMAEHSGYTSLTVGGGVQDRAAVPSVESAPRIHEPASRQQSGALGDEWVTVDSNRHKVPGGTSEVPVAERISVTLPEAAKPAASAWAAPRTPTQQPAPLKQAVPQQQIADVSKQGRKASGFIQTRGTVAGGAGRTGQHLAAKTQNRAPSSPTNTASSSTHASGTVPSNSSSASSSVCSDYGEALRMQQALEPRKSPAVICIPRKEVKQAQAAGAASVASGAKKDGKGTVDSSRTNGTFSGRYGKRQQIGSRVSPAHAEPTLAPAAAPTSTPAPDGQWAAVTASRPYAQVAREAAGSSRTQDKSHFAPGSTAASAASSPSPTYTSPSTAPCWQTPSASSAPLDGAFSASRPESLRQDVQAPQSLFSTSYIDPVYTPESCSSSPGMHLGGRPRQPFLGDSLTSLSGVGLRRRSAPTTGPQNDESPTCCVQTSDWDPSSMPQNYQTGQYMGGIFNSIWTTRQTPESMLTHEGTWSPQIAAEWGRQHAISMPATASVQGDRHDSW